VTVARGTWTITLTPKTQGLAPATDGGGWMALATRKAAGSWKWEWLLPNSNRPLRRHTHAPLRQRAGPRQGTSIGTCRW
jgi:endo-1,4-beta-D-glucanase Y